METEYKSNFNIEEYSQYYFCINNYILNIYQKRYIINNNDILNYINLIKNIFDELFEKIIKDELRNNISLANDLYDKFIKYSSETVYNFENYIKSSEFKTKIQTYYKSETENIKIESNIINFIQNNNSNNYHNNITNSNSNFTNNNNSDFNENSFIPNNNQISFFSNNIYSNIRDIPIQDKTKRLHIIKTDKENEKNEIKRKILNTYLNIDEAFIITHKVNPIYYEYYIYIRSRNPIKFPIKGMEDLEYNDIFTPNNHMKRKLMEMGNCEYIIPTQ